MKSVTTLIGSLLMPLAFNVTAHVADASDMPTHAPLERIADQLQLTVAQKSQIDLLCQAKQPAIEALIREFNLDNNELDNATAQGSIDEGKVTEIANREGATLVRLLIVEERLKVQIYATVLTHDQRVKADKLTKTKPHRTGVGSLRALRPACPGSLIWQVAEQSTNSTARWVKETACEESTIGKRICSTIALSRQAMNQR